jgi:hypothetical protein
MMNLLGLLLIGLFLPLFPLSMVFNTLFMRLNHPLLRSLLLAGWPLAGLAVLEPLQFTPPAWVLPWALATSALYALRLLVLRELNLWTAFLATSLWSLLWIAVSEGYGFDDLALDALGFSAPLILLVLVARLLEQRFGGAFSDLYSGLATALPRLAIVLVLAILAAIATPVFPGFFTMLSLLATASPLTMLVLLLVWLLWSWAGVRMLRGFIVGDGDHCRDIHDISPLASRTLMLMFVLLLALGVSQTGGLL